MISVVVGTMLEWSRDQIIGVLIDDEYPTKTQGNLLDNYKI